MPVSANQRVLGDLLKHLNDTEDDPLTPLIDEYLVKRDLPKFRKKRLKSITLDLEDRPRPGGRLSPSSVCGCERQAVLKFLGVQGKKKISPDQELIFADGHWRHHKWGVIFQDMERVLGRHRFRVVEIEGPIILNGLYVAGNFDVEIKIKVKGKWLRYVVDFKGANKFSFDTAYRNRAPHPTYVKQLLTYMKARKCKRGILLYDSKDNSRFYAFFVNMESQAWAEVSLWCRSVVEQMEEEKLPPKHPECKKGNFLYGRCMFKSICFGNESNKQLQRRVYEDFPGVDALWELGVAEIEEFSAKD